MLQCTQQILIPSALSQCQLPDNPGVALCCVVSHWSIMQEAWMFCTITHRPVETEQWHITIHWPQECSASALLSWLLPSTFSTSHHHVSSWTWTAEASWWGWHLLYWWLLVIHLVIKLNLWSRFMGFSNTHVGGWYYYPQMKENMFCYDDNKIKRQFQQQQQELVSLALTCNVCQFLVREKVLAAEIVRPSRRPQHQQLGLYLQWSGRT